MLQVFGASLLSWSLCLQKKYLWNVKQKDIREEDRRYREYLKKLKEEEYLREKELERLCDAEVEKMWEKRINQWKVEKMARQKLLEEVLESRKKQLEYKRESFGSSTDSWCFMVAIIFLNVQAFFIQFNLFNFNHNSSCDTYSFNLQSHQAPY